jgi:hypothetical protein
MGKTIIKLSPVLRYDHEKKQVRNQLNAIVCEISPDRVDQTGIFYAGNCEQRVEEMVDAWNELKGDQTPNKVAERIYRDVELLSTMHEMSKIDEMFNSQWMSFGMLTTLLKNVLESQLKPERS